MIKMKNIKRTGIYMTHSEAHIIEIVNENRILWRWILIAATLAIALITFLFLFPKKNLENIFF